MLNSRDGTAQPALTSMHTDSESQNKEQKQQPSKKKREVLWVRFWREFWILKRILHVLSLDSKIALSKHPITTLFWWTIGDPQSRPWYWLRAIGFLTIDLGLLVTSLWTTFQVDSFAAKLLLIAAPIQFVLYIMSFLYFCSSLRWFATERKYFLEHEIKDHMETDAMLNLLDDSFSEKEPFLGRTTEIQIETHEQATRLFEQLENSYAPSWGVILFELAAFTAAYISFIATLFLVYRDPGEADKVALALGVFSCFDLGLTITSVFGNAVRRLTNNKKLMKYLTIMLCLVFFPIVLLCLATYASAVVDAQYPGIANTFGFPETDKNERLLPNAASVVLTLIYFSAFICTSSVLCMCQVCVSPEVRLNEDAPVLLKQPKPGFRMNLFKPHGKLTQAREVSLEREQKSKRKSLKNVFTKAKASTTGGIKRIKSAGRTVKTQLTGVHANKAKLPEV